MSSAVLESKMFKSAAFDGIPSEAAGCRRKAEILTDVCLGEFRAQQNTERVETFMSFIYLYGTSEERACVAARSRKKDAVKKQNKTGLSGLKSLIMYQVNTLSA